VSVCVQVMFGGIVATAAGIVPIARHDVLLLGEQVARCPANPKVVCIAASCICCDFQWQSLHLDTTGQVVVQACSAATCHRFYTIVDVAEEYFPAAFLLSY